MARPLDPTLSRMDYGRALTEALLMTRPADPWVPYAQPLLDAVGLFDALSIGYALIGGVAAMYYGRPRFTEDLDFVAVTGHGDRLSTSPQEMSRFHFDPSCTWKLYHQSGLEIDLWKDEHADGIVSRATSVTLAGRSVRVADPHDLIAMKLRARRLIDDYDIAQIALNNPIDENRLADLTTPGELDAYRQILVRACSEKKAATDEEDGHR